MRRVEHAHRISKILQFVPEVVIYFELENMYFTVSWITEVNLVTIRRCHEINR